MRSQGIRQLLIKIKTRMAENSRKADQCNREFLEFWYTRYGC